MLRSLESMDLKEDNHDQIANKEGFPTSNVAKISLRQKRKYNEINNQEYRFLYKYNEGVTNSVRMTLNISYFYK